ncbi:prepronociceptin [Silurus asotus]|uniref:Prepronociceptin n=1 Tax=Silurus asotus TaxID=30991 RepID=A0AAD5A7K3_SILAS|nr:prepronociceptin [Silurus asotus]
MATHDPVMCIWSFASCNNNFCCQYSQCIMKTPLWTLLLMGLFVPGRGDCQRDCLSCSQTLSKDHNFDILVCMVECRRRVSLGITWERCHLEEKPLASLSVGNSILKRAEEEVETVLPPDQSDGSLMYSGTLQKFHHMARALGLDELDQENHQISQFSVAGHAQSAQEEPDTEDWEIKSDEPVNLSKRFGGFLKSKYGYRKFMDLGRSVQKRYGGFIGVRKSARKWNNQKRFSEFLKQYLGMTTRASEYNSVSTDITQQNEV